MKRIIWALFIVVVAASTSLCGSSESAGSDEPLDALDYFTGQWIWEGTIERHGEAPENFRWRFTSERTLDGRFLLERNYNLEAGCNLVHLSLVGWCDEDETIKAWGFWATPGSSHEEVIYTKIHDGWKITREGLDGTATIIDEETWKYEADFVTAGKKNHWGFTAKRLKSPTEEDAKKVIKMLTGEWALTLETENGGKNMAEVTATPSGSEMVLRLTYKEPGKPLANGMFAWHATKKQIVETWFSGGEHVRICFDGMTDDGALMGVGEGMLEGKRFSGLRLLKFHSADEYTHTIRDSISEGEAKPDVTITARRIVSEPVK
jgi:hypothetical protein